MRHIGSTPGKVLFKVLFFALFLGKTLFLELLLVLKKEKENLLRVKCFTVQMKLEITQRHLFLGARSQHLGGGW